MGISDFTIAGATIRTWRANYRQSLAELKDKHGDAYDPEVHHVTTPDPANVSFENSAVGNIGFCGLSDA